MDTDTKKLIKDKNHSHYWIKDSVLYESYSTIRGVRFRQIATLPLISDQSRLNTEEIEFIEKYLSDKNHE